MKKSPFFAMMGWYHPAPSWKNGDESSKEAAAIAAAPVPVGIRAAVSHAAGLEASPTSRSQATFPAAVGPAAAGAGLAGDDLDGGRFRAWNALKRLAGSMWMSYEARKRPGKTLAGFQKALARLPMRQLWALAQGVRDQIQRNYAERLVIDGLIPMGCDGSRVECPRAVELEARLGKGSKETSAPTAWVTAFVHLGLGLLWSWRIGKRHRRRTAAFLRQMLCLLRRRSRWSWRMPLIWAMNWLRAILGRTIGHTGFDCRRRTGCTRLTTPLSKNGKHGQVYYWPETGVKRTAASALVPTDSHQSDGTDEKRRLAAGRTFSTRKGSP